MKSKTIRRMTAMFLCIILMTSFLPSFVSAGVTSSMNVSIRIEGISGNFYDQTLSIPYSTPTLSVQAALLYADAQSVDITITGLSTGFITDVNGDTAATFGGMGWDGWSYTVNSTSPVVGMDACILNSGDSIVLYYGDPFNVGMQYPEIDSSRLGEGILKFTSQDTSYATGSPVVTTNPIAGATVTWYYSSTTATFTTNANGEITIPQGQLTAGSHRIQIEKYGTTAASGKYLPLVLRLSKNASVTVVPASSSISSSSSSSSSSGLSGSSSNGSGNAPTGDSSIALPLAGLLLSLAAMAVLLRKRKRNVTKE